MESLLKDMVGSRVAVWSLAGSQEHRDDGILREVDSHMLMLEAGGEMLYFPLNNVRLIKILQAHVEDNLLRAYRPEEPQ